MARYPQSKPPDGYALTQYSDGTWQAWKLDAPAEKGPRVTRRITALLWTYKQLSQK